MIFKMVLLISYCLFWVFVYKFIRLVRLRTLIRLMATVIFAISLLLVKLVSLM